MTVTINDPSNTDVTAEPASLTFSSTDWSTPKTVTVNAAQDADAEGETATVTHTVTSTDSSYSAASANSVSVTVTDDDDAGVSVSEAALTIAEGSSGTYTIVLDSQPTANVTVTINDPTDNTDVTADPADLTFASTDWSTPQTVTVSAAQDADAENDTATVTHTVASTDTSYSAASANSVTVTITDDEVPVAVSFGQANYTVAEGDPVSVTVTLSADPERTVVIPLTHTPQGNTTSADYSGVPANVTFSTGDMSQTITFTATQDDVDDGGKSVLLGFGTTLPGGVSLGTTTTTTVNITDDDDAGVSVSEAALIIAEGSSDTYTIVLDSQPTAAVTVTIVDPTDNTDVTAEPTSLTFSSTDWSTPKTVTVNAARDADAEGETATVTHTVTSTDSSYSAASANSVSVIVTDDDTAGVSVSEAELTIAEGSSDTYTIVLDSQPTAAVTVTINDPSNTDVTADPADLTFASTDWSTPQTVTVSAAQDADAENDTATVTHTVASTDTSYSGASASSVTVTITDDEVPVAVSFGQANYTVAEGDPVSVTVTLSADPERTVVIPLTHTPQGNTTSADYSGVPANVTFSTGDMSQTITFTATQDDVDDGGKSVLLGFGTTLPGGVSLGTTTTTTVNITDDDGAGVTVSNNSLTIVEGSSGTYTIVLDSQPTVNVTVTINDPTDNTDVTADPADLTFASTDWSTPQTVTVSAAQDADAENDTATVTHTVASTDTSYSGASASSVTVTITDDDPQQGDLGGNVGRRGTVVTIERVPDGTVIPDNSSLAVGVPVVGNSTFMEGTQALFRLKFEAVGGGPPVGDGVDVDLRFSWHIPSPPVTAHGYHGYATQGTWSLHRVDVWDTAVPIHDNDFGHPDGTVTIRIIGCERSGCIIGTPSVLTVTIADDDGGPAAAVPGPPGVPRLVCARSGDGYDDTGIAVSWKAPNFVGGAPVESYELRYRESSRFVGGTLIEHPWESWRHGVAATSATLTGLVPRANYTVQVRAVSANGPGLWSEPWYFRVGPTDEVCEIIDQLTPQPLNPPRPASAQQSLSNTPAEGEPRIDGIPELGQTLSADTTAIADADGLENVVFQYQWLAEDADIPGATGATYTVVSGDVGKAIKVRVTFTDDAGQEETLTSVPIVVTAAGLQIQSATVDGATLTLTYSEVLDTGVTLGTAAFAVNVNGSSRSLIAVGVGQSNVLLLLSSAVEAGDTVTVDYTAPDGPDFIRDIRGRKAASFSGQSVTNDTASPPLTASAHDAPSSHNGQDAFTFELRFSEDPEPDFSYTTVRDHAFTVTGGSVTYVRRLEPGKNVRWEITVTPGSSADVTIDLNATTDCSAQGATCTEDGGKLSGGLLLAVPPPNTPATGAATITGAAQVGETLTADTTGIADGDGLDNATFAYQWLADNAEIDSATASSYTLVAADAGKAIKVRVSFADDAGNDEQLTSAATGAVAAAPPPPNTPATGLPTITGTARVGETLTAGTTGISDGDGLNNATFTYQWLADDAEIDSATTSSYTLVTADAGKAIKVRVSFTDDGGNDEELTSAATSAVAAVVKPPLTATVHDVPPSYHGQDAFIFELRFSEAPKPDFSYTTVRDHAFTVTGGSVTYVRRLEPGKNVRWEITVTPDSSADVAIALNATTDCTAQGAICTEDGRKLFGGLELTVNGPGQ